MKKLCFIALAALLACLMLCSCGAQGKTDTTDTGTPTMSTPGTTNDGAQTAASMTAFFPKPPSPLTR